MCGASMPSTRRALGDFGESTARSHLLRAGYQIVASNWRCPIGEIDLVARQGGQLVFVEVRTRRLDGPVAPEESLSPAKRRRLAALALAYLAAASHADQPSFRIDLIAVAVDRTGRVAHLDHIVSAIEEQ
jgi:putative endonuclease